MNQPLYQRKNLTVKIILPPGEGNWKPPGIVQVK
jgi:hypothetical protein